MTKLLRMVVLLSVIPALAFGQRGGGGHGGGGGARSGGGGARIGGGGGARIGGGSVMRGGGFTGGSFARGGNVIARGGGVRVGGSGFRGNTIVRGGTRFGNTRFFGGRSFYGGFYPGLYLGFGYGSYPYYPYSYYPYSYYPYSYDPYYYDSYVYAAPYDNGAYYDSNVGYAAQPAPVAPTVINQNIGASTSPSGSFYRAADYYLIAFTDHTIRAALSYSVDGDQIRYTTREHEERTAPLSSVDVRFSEQINRDRRVEFRLP
jgi:hypothetical protein